MAWMETKPAFRSLRIVGRRASARTSATRLLASPLLIPPRSDMSRSRTRKHPRYGGAMPPTANGARYPPMFNSFASPRWETKPAAISSRMVGSKTRAPESAARLSPNAPCIPRLLGKVSPRTRSIGPSWQGFDAGAGQSNEVHSRPTNKRRPTQELCNPGRAFDLPVHPRSGQSEHSNGGEAGLWLHTIIPRRSWRVTSLGARRGDGGPARPLELLQSGDLGWGSRKIARRAGVDETGEVHACNELNSSFP